MSKTPSPGTGEAMPISQNIELTRKGVDYCEAHGREAIRAEAAQILEGCLDLADRMIAVLDRLDGDCDLEPFLAGFDGIDDDREADYEHGMIYGGSNGCADYEPKQGV